MAVITGLNAIGTGSAGNALQNTMYAIGQKTPAEIAKAAQTKEVKAKVLVATTTDTKPASLPPGEVVKLTNDKGKVEYYVGTYDGKVSKPLKSVNSAVDTVNTQIKKVEQVQATALRTSQKIELDEIKQAATQAGLPKSEISKIIKNEKAANTIEATQLKSLLSAPSLQYGVRDPSTNTFVNNTVNGITAQAATPKSLLTLNDPVIAPTIQSNIKSANDAVAEFQLLKGVTEPFLPSGNTTSGVNPYAVYKAIDNGSIIATKDATGNTTGYTVSDAVAAAKGDQSGFMDATGMSKASARALGLILNNDAVIGGKANVVVDGKGNYFVNDASGADRYGTQKPLIDTGRVDGQGNKVFAEVSTDNSKRNLVSVVSNYVRQPDGSFKYAGVDSTDYTHIEGFNPIKALVIAGMSAGFGAGAGALSGLSGSAATAVGGAVGGATGAALSGSNILKGALLGGLGGFGVGEVQAAAQAAGGYENLLGQVSSGNFSSFTEAGQQAANAANAAASASGVDGGGGGFAGAGEPQAGIDFGNLSADGFDYSIPQTSITNENISNFNKFGNSDPTLPLTKTNGFDYSIPNASITNENINNYLKYGTSDPGVFDYSIPDYTIKAEDINLEYKPPTASDGLLDAIKNIGSTAVGTLGIPGTIGAAGLIGSTIANSLAKTPEEPVYTAPLLVPGQGPSTGVTDWTQYYNNLFKRQGVGAGQYLGYDIMNRINVPPELMGLLGTSAQATPTPTTTTA